MAAALPFDPIAEAERQWVAHGWPDAALGMAAVTSVMRAHQLMLASVDAMGHTKGPIPALKTPSSSK